MFERKVGLLLVRAGSSVIEAGAPSVVCMAVMPGLVLWGFKNPEMPERRDILLNK